MKLLQNKFLGQLPHFFSNYLLGGQNHTISIIL